MPNKLLQLIITISCSIYLNIIKYMWASSIIDFITKAMPIYYTGIIIIDASVSINYTRMYTSSNKVIPSGQEVKYRAQLILNSTLFDSLGRCYTILFESLLLNWDQPFSFMIK